MNGTQNPVFIGCDWGSSNFRLALLDRGGELIGEYANAGGIVILRQQGLDTNALVNHLSAGLVALSQICAMDLSALPIVISGMAGSSLGICEVPYASLPFSVSGEGLISHLAGPFAGIPNPVSIIAGVCSEDDVMRGEETEAVGLLNGLSVKDALLILPGTHSKHLVIRDGRICDFKTHMTGELFQVISSKTILTHVLQDASTDPFDDPGRSCFLEGLEMAGSADLMHQLFTLRSRVLLKRIQVRGNIHRLSGLMIGYELLQMNDLEAVPILLGGTGPLYDRYRFALEQSRFASQLIDIPAVHRSRAIWRGQSLRDISSPRA